MCILIGFGVFFLCHREKQWQKPSKFVDYAINMQMALLTFLICACFNILNEFLCALVSVSPPRFPPSHSGFAVKAVDNDDIEDNDALLLLQRCCRLFGLRVSAFFISQL